MQRSAMHQWSPFAVNRKPKENHTMALLNNIKMKPKLISLFLLVGLIPLIAIGLISVLNAEAALMTQANNNLEAVHEIKRDQITKYAAERQGDMGVLVKTVDTLREETFSKLEALLATKTGELTRYFDSLAAEIRVLKDNPTTLEAMERFEAAFEAEGGRVGGAKWSEVEGDLGAIFAGMMADFGYYDIFLIAADGDVVYTVAKEADLGKNISSAELSASGLARAFKAAADADREGIAFVDFQPYAPSGGEPAAFAAASVYDAAGQFAGAIAYQVPLAEINAIMTERAGMGQTGECYLVGPDKLMRSDSYLDPVNHTVNASFANPGKGIVDTVAAQNALAGTAGQGVIADYNGNPVLSIYQPIDIHGVRWAAICEMDVAEAFSPVDAQGNEYYAQYTALYGYYDLFLINPDGYVFYSVSRESDYQTNMVNGVYSSSNLGQLVRDVLESNSFGFADFQPYAPSGGEPAAFIAEPLVHNGQIEVIVALQLPLEGINSIMQVREGMGETGETYLVGPDKRMRSDSFLDAAGRSVAASFGGTVEQNGVDTEGVRRALAGQDGKDVLSDYNGNQVLTAYGPVQFFDTTWAMLADIDEVEVKAPSVTLRNTILAIGGGVALVVALLALAVALAIASPIQKVTRIAGVISEGDLNQEVDINQGDEIGQLASAFRRLIAYMQEMAGAADQMADGNLTVDVTPQSERDQLGNAFSRMIANLRGLISQVQEGSAQVAAASEQISGASEQAAQATQQVAGTVQQVAQGTAQQTQSTTQAGAQVDQMTSAIDGIAKGSQEQSRGIERVSASAAQMSAAVEQVAANAQASATASEQAASTAQSGAHTVRQAVDAIGAIKNTVTDVGVKVNQMQEYSSQIGAIVETIDDIAEQTNLLALNAAIEAARAGEQGRGFAVVADEVRKLAERSGKATKEIAGLIGNVQTGTEQMVQAMTANLQQVEVGSGFAGEAGEALGEILKAANLVTSQVKEIAAAVENMSTATNELMSGIDSVSAVVEENTAATEELAASSNEVSAAMQSVAAVSEENAASVEEVSATAEEVSAQVEEMAASAQSLAAVAGQLQAAAAQFKLNASQGTPAAKATPRIEQAPKASVAQKTLALADGNGHS
jgi:methyl-accepting chemotaxis protein